MTSESKSPEATSSPLNSAAAITYTAEPTRQPSFNSGSDYDSERRGTVRSIGFLKLRGKDDDLPQSWWFASTAIPLLAATIGPLSNVLSIAALVTPWRVTLPNNGELPEGADDNGIGIADPRWEIILNACSLACGFTGNVFLLLNFTGRVRYIIALPLSIVFWYLAAAILISITTCMNAYVPPIWPGEIYSQGFWHAVLAAILYVIGAFMLMANMLGYALGHYPQKFDLDDHQRTLILQTMMFMYWLAAGAAIFVRIEGWTFTNALYWCDVSVLTIGFGDFYPVTDAGRGFLFVFELLGIIQLGLVISSISKFASSISADKIVKAHQKHKRAYTFGRTVTNESELRERLGLPPRRQSAASSASSASGGDRRESTVEKYGRLEIVGRNVTFHEKKAPVTGGGRGGAARSAKPLSRDAKMRARASGNNPQERRRARRQKLLLLKEEKDRFDAMREIQDDTRRFKQYYSLGIAFLAFSTLWCLGAMVFYFSEARLQELTYFECLYFCFVALLTIGYGDIGPKSNVSKPFFIVWSLIAVPTMTVLIQEMSSTVVAAVNHATFILAEWTILPKKGVFKAFLDQHPRIQASLQHFVDRSERKKQKERVQKGFQVQNPDLSGNLSGDADATAEETERHLERLTREVETEHDLARQLAMAIQKVAHDLAASTPVRYTYEQWAHFTKLIRFSRRTKEEVEALEEVEGLVEWDWIGEDSPMLADVSEAQWVLERLCESLSRYTRKQAVKMNRMKRRRRSNAVEIDYPEVIEETEDEHFGGESASEVQPTTSPSTPSSSASSTTVTESQPGSLASPEVTQWAERMRQKMDQDLNGSKAE